MISDNIWMKVIDTTDEYRILNHLLFSYISELHHIDSHVQVRTEEELANEYFGHPDTILYLFYADFQVIGFAILGIKKNTHPLVPYYLMEFYIKPEYRNQGYGFQAAQLLLKDKPSICFFILKKNTVAKQFWSNVFYAWHDQTECIYDISEAPDYLSWHVYSLTT